VSDRSAAARIGWQTRRANPQPARHLHLVPPTREVWTPPRRLLGRALIVLSQGPLTFEGLASVLGISESELEERCEELRGHVESMRVGSTWIAHLRTESWFRIWPLREALLTSERMEVRRG
jgi:hypothetical protein